MLLFFVFISVIAVAACTFLLIINFAARPCRCCMMILNVCALRAFFVLMFCSCAARGGVCVLIFYWFDILFRAWILYFYVAKKTMRLHYKFLLADCFFGFKHGRFFNLLARAFGRLACCLIYFF